MSSIESINKELYALITNKNQMSLLLQQEINKLKGKESLLQMNSNIEKENKILSMIPEVEFTELFDYVNCVYGSPENYLEFEQIEELMLSEEPVTIYNLMNLVSIKNKLQITDFDIHDVFYKNICKELNETYMGV